MKSRTAGVLGILGAVIFFAASVLSATTFEYGVYSPISCFVTELGAYTGGYMGVSSALIFNTGMIASGLLISVFMVMYGIRKNSALYTATSFAGVLCGMLITAEGIFTLNFPVFHIILVSAFSVSAFTMCLLHIIAEMRSNNRGSGLIGCIIAFFAGAASAAFAVFAFTGGVQNVIAEDLSGAARPYFIPFAAVQWAAYLLLFAFVALVSVKMLTAKLSSKFGNESRSGKDHKRGAQV